VSTRFLVLYWFPRDDAAEEPRLGLAVPKRVGTAVARTRVKRRLREVWRARLEGIPAGCDYVLVVRPGFVHSKMTQGLDAAPLATDPEAVAAAIVTGLGRGADTVWAPNQLRYVMSVLRHLPRVVFRRLPI